MALIFTVNVDLVCLGVLLAAGAPFKFTSSSSIVISMRTGPAIKLL